MNKKWIARILLAVAITFQPVSAQIYGGTIPVFPKYIVSALPASPVIGQVVIVTDAIACTFLVTPTGGGSVVCPLMYNGVAWVAH